MGYDQQPPGHLTTGDGKKYDQQTMELDQQRDFIRIRTGSWKPTPRAELQGFGIDPEIPAESDGARGDTEKRKHPRDPKLESIRSPGFRFQSDFGSDGFMPVGQGG